MATTTTATSVPDTFPFPIISKMHAPGEEPDYARLQEAFMNLNANAASVNSNAGDGRLGLIHLTIGDAEYQIISTAGVPFVPPPNPGANPVIPANSTSAAIAEIRRQFTEASRIYRVYVNTDAALKKQVIAAVDDEFISVLKNDLYGYALITTRQLITHLKTTYGTISQTEIDHAADRLKSPWTIDTPIETLFRQFDKNNAIMMAGNQGLTVEQVVAAAYKLVAATGHFESGCRDWRKKSEAQKTWAAFKVHFKEAEKDRKLEATTGSAGFANNAEMIQCVTHEAVQAAVANWTQIQAQTQAPGGDTLARFERIILNLESELKKTNEELAKIKATGGGGSKKPTKRNYCWTHGCTYGVHTSAACRSKAEGHQDAATYRNRLGGSNANDPAIQPAS